MPRRRPSPTPETPEAPPAEGFAVSFAAPPPTAAANTEAVQRPDDENLPPAFPPSAQPTVALDIDQPINLEPADFVRVLQGTVGLGGDAYAAGSSIPVMLFDTANLERLLALRVVEYDAQATRASAADQTLGAARRVAQSPGLNQVVPTAPWAQCSLGEILGPAIPRGREIPRPAPPQTPFATTPR